mmetsp:Transcript_5545/g.14651  ORF Transcript_5545/g.14651 Transcript_5545/m.14651 type:complete len:280 (+) Transcript_5545:120-959(+)
MTSSRSLAAADQKSALQDSTRSVVHSARAALTHLLLASSCSDSAEASCGFLLLIPGGGHASVHGAADDELAPCGLWSTAKFAQEHGLEVGTMIRYIEWALKCGTGASRLGHHVQPVVLRSYAPETIVAALDKLEAEARARGHNTPVVIAAHSEGGAAAVQVLRDHERWVSGYEGAAIHISGMALLDSVHSYKDLPPKGSQVGAFLLSGAVVNWVSSSAPLDSVKPKPWVKDGVLGGVRARSAGTNAHLEVPSAAFSAVCSFLLQRLYDASPSRQDEQAA